MSRHRLSTHPAQNVNGGVPIISRASASRTAFGWGIPLFAPYRRGGELAVGVVGEGAPYLRRSPSRVPSLPFFLPFRPALCEGGYRIPYSAARNVNTSLRFQIAGEYILRASSKDVPKDETAKAPQTAHPALAPGRGFLRRDTPPLRSGEAIAPRSISAAYFAPGSYRYRTTSSAPRRIVRGGSAGVFMRETRV